MYSNFSGYLVYIHNESRAGEQSSVIPRMYIAIYASIKRRLNQCRPIARINMRSEPLQRLMQDTAVCGRELWCHTAATAIIARLAICSPGMADGLYGYPSDAVYTPVTIAGFFFWNFNFELSIIFYDKYTLRTLSFISVTSIDAKRRTSTHFFRKSNLSSRWLGLCSFRVCRLTVSRVARCSRALCTAPAYTLQC